MKPRLRVYSGLWHCAAHGIKGCGIGYTPSEAYGQWVFAVWALKQP